MAQGLEFGNILSQASTIKTARARQEREELLLEKEKAPIELQKNILAKKAKKEFEEYSDLEDDSEYPSSMIKTLSPEEEQRANILAPEVAQQTKKTQQVQALTNYYMKKGQSKQEAELRAVGYSDDIDNFDKEYRTKTKFQQEQIRTNISQQGQQIQGLLEVAKQDPQRAEGMYQDYIKGKNEQIKQLLRDGQTEIADKIQESLDKAPQTLIKPDGSFDAEFPMMSLSKMSTMMQNAETYDLQKKSDIKVAEAEAKPTAMSAEERRTESIITLRDKKRQGTLSPMETDRLSLNEALNKKATEIREGVSEEAKGRYTNNLTNFAIKQGLDNFTDFSDKITNGDMSVASLDSATRDKLTDLAQTENSVIKTKLNKDDEKTLQALKQTTNVIEVMRGADFTDNYGPIDKYKDDVMRYFRGDENAAKSAMINSFLKSATVNANIKGVPSNADLKLISEGLADRTMNEDQAAKMMIAALNKDINEAKDTISRSSFVAPATTIAKYGDVVADLQGSIKIIEQVFKQKEEQKTDDLSRLRETKPKDTRQSMFQQIAAKRPNATPEQINAYLNSRGY